MSPESCEGLIGKGLKLCWGSTNDHPEQRSWFANTSIKCEQQNAQDLKIKCRMNLKRKVSALNGKRASSEANHQIFM